MKDDFSVRVEDLPEQSSALVDVECDGCKSILRKKEWRVYKKYVKENGEYFCTKCARRLYRSMNEVKMRLLKSEPISITHPHLIRFLIDIEDSNKYSMGSRIKIPMKCSECGFEKEMAINTLRRQGFGCHRCSDGVSYPEKFIFNVLDQLGIEFETQLSRLTFEWCERYRYDFYINKHSCIIETNGDQHYTETNGSWKSLSLEVNKDKDKRKRLKAIENGIKNYIAIDCRNSNVKWIKNSVMNSALPIIFNFKEGDIDWLKCHEYACSSLVKKACNLWSNGIKNRFRIAEIMKIGRETALKYLKQGSLLGWCDYNSMVERKKSFELTCERNKVRVVCVTTNEIFESIKKACEKYNLHSPNITNCCQGKSKYAGRHPETGERLLWMRYDEYVLNNTVCGWREDYLNKHSGKVVCLTTGEIFNSQNEASKKYHISSGNLSNCCSGKYKYAGVNPVNKEPLIWMSYYEYVNKPGSPNTKSYSGK